MNDAYLIKSALIGALSSDSLSPISINYSAKFDDSSSDMSYGLSSAQELSIPVDAIRNNSSLEAIVVYLKDSLDLKFSQISRLLNRDQRTIWATYSKAKGKAKKNIGDKGKISASNSIRIPLGIFRSRKFSILESIVLFLKNEYGLSFNEISAMLGKNYRTIWTIYRRALVKVDNNA